MNDALHDDPPRLRRVQCQGSRGLHRMACRERGDAATRRVTVRVHGPSRQRREFLLG